MGPLVAYENKREVSHVRYFLHYTVKFRVLVSTPPKAVSLWVLEGTHGGLNQQPLVLNIIISQWVLVSTHGGLISQQPLVLNVLIFPNQMKLMLL